MIYSRGIECEWLPEIVPIKVFCHFFRISEEEVRKYMETGEVQAIKISKHITFIIHPDGYVGLKEFMSIRSFSRYTDLPVSTVRRLIKEKKLKRKKIGKYEYIKMASFLEHMYKPLAYRKEEWMAEKGIMI